MKVSNTLAGLSLCLVASSIMAKNVEIVGNIPVTIKPSPSLQQLQSNKRQELPKVVLLQKVKLSKAAVKQMANVAQTIKQTNKTSKDLNGESMELGMGNVPVLDQGMHGSCVTFANTGAIDAVYQQGDYVSQLCSLALGKTLEKDDPDFPNGWDGSWGPLVLGELMEYGVVTKDRQRLNGCGGLKEYPKDDANKTGSAMSVEDYTDMAESIKESITWNPILDTIDAFRQDSHDPDKVLADVKQALKDGHRVTFGVLLDVYQGMNGATGMHNGLFDTWMLNDAIIKDAEEGKIDAGHEMIITGFDDNATAFSFDGNFAQGLLTLRNSWGTWAGDKGNYYMSYDHFKLLTMEAQEIVAK
jgi:hypothetical protein